MRTSIGDERPFALPEFTYSEPGLRPGVDLLDGEQVAELLCESVLG